MASLVIALIALVIALLSAIYTRRQAVEAAGLHEIERARHLEERRPTLSGEIKRLGGATARLDVTLESHEPLSAVEVVIPRGQGITFDRNVYGVVPVKPGNVALAAFACNPYTGDAAGMEPRGTVSWKIDLADKHVSDLRLEAICHGPAGQRWDAILIRAHVQPDISKTVW
ncbi:MAG TPA: hypothetical protein VNF47_21475 [Streptosporangiaceae bacterium]|nr:hypothetical protein [Streptosporangiaceae bacterium]